MLRCVAAIVAIGAFTIFAVPSFISAEDVRNRLFAEIESATGYRLTVSGSIHISAFPSLKLIAEGVGVARSGGADTAQLATARELRFGLALPALLGGKVQVTEIALIQPVIRMPEAGANAGAPASTGTGSGAASMSNALQTLSLDKLVIEDGIVILRGEGRAPGKRIEAITLEASLAGFDAPLSLDLTAMFEGQPVEMAGSIAKFGPFLDGTAAPISLEVKAPAYFPERVALSGSAIYTGDTFVLEELSAKAGDTTLRGSLSTDLSGDLPHIKASLHGDRLNLVAVQGSDGKAPSRAGGDTDGWSDAKIDFSGLKAVSAELNLSVERLSYGTIKAGPIGIRTTMAGGKLRVELPNFQLYDGVGTGVLSVDATGKTPVQTFRFSLSNLDAYPFLDDVAGFQRVEGKGAIIVNLATSGASQRAMVSALNGTASFEFADGALRGINIGKMVRNLTSGTLSGWQSGEAAKTDFASLGANFKIAQGKAQTNDLHLSGPLVRMAGAGRVDLPARTLNFRVDPRVVASLEGQGGEKDLQGLGVSVAIAGPWARPSVYPDIAGILENPQAAYERLSKLGGGLFTLPGSDGLGETLNGTGGIADLVKEKAGAPIEDLIQAGQGAQQPDVVTELRQILGADRLSAPAPAEPAAPQTEAPSKQKGKKKQAEAVIDADSQPLPKQLMQGLLGSFQ